jgi:hypothetical protein
VVVLAAGFRPSSFPSLVGAGCLPSPVCFSLVNPERRPRNVRYKKVSGKIDRQIILFLFHHAKWEEPQMIHLSYCTQTPALSADIFTSPYYSQWAARHKQTCTGSFIANAFEGLLFGSQVPYVYTDIECMTCHEHYIELYPTKG